MNEQPKSLSRAHLHAYVDNALKQTRRADVVDLLKTHPDLTEHVRAYRQINQELHKLFDRVLQEPLPQNLDDRRDKQPGEQEPRRGRGKVKQRTSNRKKTAKKKGVNKNKSKVSRSKPGNQKQPDIPTKGDENDLAKALEEQIIHNTASGKYKPKKKRSLLSTIVLGMLLGSAIGITIHQSGDTEWLSQAKNFIVELISRFL
jgi:hypothetical protein